MTRKENIYLSVLILVSVVLSFVSGFLVKELLDKRSHDLAVLIQAKEILTENAFDPLPADPELEYGMIRGMIDAYGDPFTSFYEPVQHELQTDELEGAYGSIGVTIERDPVGRTVLYPFPEGPASLAGIKDGDILEKVDGQKITSDMPVEAVTAAIRGPVDSKVIVEILRGAGFEPHIYEITRTEFPLPSVTWRLAPQEPAIGLIEVNLIAEKTPEEIERAAKDLAAQGAMYYVLDLRDNGGGLLHSGIQCAELFLDEGIVMQQQYRGKEVVTFKVNEPGPLAGLSAVVWVNRGTASASEICAGALQMHGFALFGTHTFGKDVIQLVFELQDGSSIQVSAAKWWFPDLKFPNNGIGLVPDFVVEGDITALVDETRRYFGIAP